MHGKYAINRKLVGSHGGESRDICPKGANSFPLRVAPHEKGRQKCKIDSLENLPIQLKH